MDTSYSKPAGQISGSSMESAGDWRVQVSADSRPRVLNRMLEILKNWRLSYSGDVGLQEHMKIAAMYEEKIFSGSTSQSDYLRKISLKILAMETRVRNMPDSMESQVPINIPDYAFMQLNSIINSLKPSSPDHKDGVIVNEVEDINPYKRDPLCEIVGPMTRSRTKSMINDALASAKLEAQCKTRR